MPLAGNVHRLPVLAGWLAVESGMTAPATLTVRAATFDIDVIAGLRGCCRALG